MEFDRPIIQYILEMQGKKPAPLANCTGTRMRLKDREGMGKSHL